MGARGSTLAGRGTLDPRMAKLSQLDEAGIIALRKRHDSTLSGRLPLEAKHVAALLPLTKDESFKIFRVFDTDGNNFVDAFEMMAAVTMMSSVLSLERKIDLVEALFDFSGTGHFGFNEFTIMLRTVVNGCSKFDHKIVPPNIDDLERLTRWAFQKAERCHDEDISKLEIHRFLQSDPVTGQFLDYFGGGMKGGQVIIPPGTMWIDPDDPTMNGSFFRRRRRPSDIVAFPRLFLGSAFTFGHNLVPGMIADGKVLSAIGMIASTSPKTIRNLFVTTGQEHHGRYAVTLTRNGVDDVITIDDRIPCDVTGTPVLSRTTDPPELWPLLLEKALAKFFGSYDALKAQTIDDTLVALTGGTVIVNAVTDDWWSVFCKAGIIDDDSLDQYVLGVVAKRTYGDPGGSKTVLAGRGYGILGALETKDRRLVHLANPWAESRPVSVDMDDDLKAALRFDPDDTTSFWIDARDLERDFDAVYVCRLYEPYEWTSHRRGAAVSTGVSLDDPSWVAKNPQFYLEIDDCPEKKSKKPKKTSGIVVELAQENLRSLGLLVASFAFEQDRGHVTKFTAVTTANLRALTPLTRKRQISTELQLPKGKYVVIPLFSPGEPTTVWLTAKSKGPKLRLLSEAEVVHPTHPSLGTADDVPIPAPLAAAEDHDEVPDQDALAFYRLAEVVGSLWLSAYRLEEQHASLLRRLSTYLAEHNAAIDAQVPHNKDHHRRGGRKAKHHRKHHAHHK